MFFNRHTVPDRNDGQTALDFRAYSVQSVHDIDKYQSIYELDFAMCHERRPLHSRLSSNFVAPLANAVHFENCLFIGVDLQHHPDHSDNPACERSGTNWQPKVVRYRMVERHQHRSAHLLHVLLIRIQLLHPAKSNYGLLLQSAGEIENGRTEESVQGKETVPSQSYQPRTDSGDRLRYLLASVLGLATGTPIWIS